MSVDIPEIGQKVRSKISDALYKIKPGDIGEVTEIHAGKGVNSYIICSWPNRKRDLGWWIYPQPPLKGTGEPIVHVLSNLEFISDMEDTRDYLDSITTLA